MLPRSMTKVVSAGLGGGQIAGASGRVRTLLIASGTPKRAVVRERLEEALGARDWDAVHLEPGRESAHRREDSDDVETSDLCVQLGRSRATRNRFEVVMAEGV